MILHADVDAFFASVAQRDDPALRGLPVVVGGGVVMAASYEARAYGVRSGMGGGKARRLCPDLVVARPSFDAYTAASRALFAIFRARAPVVEPGSLEEAFLSLPGVDAVAGADAARALRGEVRAELGLPLSVGVAPTKVLAKIASRSAKPDGLFVVPPGRELAFLHPLGVERIWGIGDATTAKLHAHGVLTVADAAALGEGELIAVLGKAAGKRVHAIAHNRDPRPVQRRSGRRSMGSQRALGRGPRSREEIAEAVTGLVERVCGRMAGRQRAARTVVLRLRFGDYTRATRSATLARATRDPAVVIPAVLALLGAAQPLIEDRGITLVGITLAGLEDTRAGEQLTLEAP